jgi:hypothetical protein
MTSIIKSIPWIVSDGFESNNANVTITFQRSTKVGNGYLTNNYVAISTTSDLPAQTSLFKPKNTSKWSGVTAYYFKDNGDHMFRRNADGSVGIKTNSSLPAGDYRIFFAY